MLPINMRYKFYSDKLWFMNIGNDTNNTELNSSIYNYAILSSIKKLINIKNNDLNYYNIFHSDITHEPLYYNSDYLPDFVDREPDKYDLSLYKNNWGVRHFYCNVSSLNLIIDFLDFLKDNNVYDNTKIIVASDHGAPVVTHQFGITGGRLSFYNALLLYKDFNSRNKLIVDNSFSTIADVPYLITKHIPNITDPFNNKIITNDRKTNGVYMIWVNWDPRKQYSNSYNFNNYFYVKDNIFNLENWKKFEIDWNTKESKEIELK